MASLPNKLTGVCSETKIGILISVSFRLMLTGAVIGSSWVTPENPTVFIYFPDMVSLVLLQSDMLVDARSLVLVDWQALKYWQVPLLLTGLPSALLRPFSSYLAAPQAASGSVFFVVLFLDLLLLTFVFCIVPQHGPHGLWTLYVTWNSVLPHLPVLLSLLKAWLLQWRFWRVLSVFCLFLDPFPVPLSNVLVVSGCRWWGSQFPTLVPPSGTLGLFALGIQPSVSSRCYVNVCQRRFHLPEAYPLLEGG